MKSSLLKWLSYKSQGILWLVGINWHNTLREECTPDFSCCTNIRTPFLKRAKFVFITHPIESFKYKRYIRRESKING